MSTLRAVHLHGYLAEFHPGPVYVACSNALEAVEAVTRQLPGFHPHPKHGRHRIQVAGCREGEDLVRPLAEGEAVHIVPQLTGGKKGGFIQIILGAALLAVAFFVPGLGAFGSILMKMGAMMLLGGIMQLLAPTPGSDTSDEEKSRYLGTPKNTVKIGTRIPVPYGRNKIFGHYLSFDVSAKDFKGRGKNSGGGSSGK